MPTFVRPKKKDDSLPYKRSSDATTATMASEDSSDNKQNSLTRRSLSERARVFDKSYSKSPKKISKESHLQNLLDTSDHRKKSKVIHGRRATYRDKKAREMGIVIDESTKEAEELKALLDASLHRKRAHVTDGVKPVYRPSDGKKKSSMGFSIIPKGKVQLKKMQMGPKMQKLLDDSQHKKLMHTSSAHRLAHRMMQASQHLGLPTFTFNLRKVKNRFKPALPAGATPLPPTETTFHNVHAPKLTVDINTFEAPSYPKTKAQQELIREAIEKNTFVLKHQTPAAAETLIDAMEPVEFRLGQILQRQGETRPEDDHLYVVEEGHVHVKVDGKVVDTIRAGQTFGQERLLLRKENEATIQAGATVTKLFRLDQMTFRAILQKQYQYVLEELKAKTPRIDNSTTWHDNIYNRKSDHQSEYEEITIEDEYYSDEYDEITTDDEDDLVSFEDDDSATDSMVDESIAVVSKTSSSKISARDIVDEKKKKKSKVRRSKIFSFEDSPVFQKQEALRRSACKYASSKDDLEFIKVLGEGQFGEVWLVAATLPDHDPSRQEFALKIQKISGDDSDEAEDAKDAIRNEIKALQTLHHPFIVNLVHTYESEDSMDMLLGLIPGGELWEEIHRQEPDGNWVSGIAEGKARFYAYVLTDTLGFLHSRGYIFRDLKPENIMIDQDGYPIIVDFGFAKYLNPDEKTFTFCGTPNYVAPEIITSAGHGKEVDYWALGVVIYEMVSGENPFFYDGMEQFALYEAITEEDPYEMSDNVTASDQVRELTDLLFIKDPYERLGSQGAHEILDHAWFRGMPDLSEIHAKRVDPRLVSELNFDEIESAADSDDEDSFAETEIEPLNDIPEDKSQSMEFDLPKEFGKHARSNSFDDSRLKNENLDKVPRRKSADDAVLYDDEEEAEEEEQDSATPLMSPMMGYNPDSPKTIKYWTPRKKGLGYYVNMKTPEQRLSSQSRRSVVGDFLSQYLENIDLNDEEVDYLTKTKKGQGNQKNKLNASCPAFR